MVLLLLLQDNIVFLTLLLHPQIDLSVTVGNFEAQSGVDVSLITDEQMAEEVRARIPGTDKTSFVVSFAFGIKKDVERKSLSQTLFSSFLALISFFSVFHWRTLGSHQGGSTPPAEAAQVHCHSQRRCWLERPTRLPRESLV